MEIKQLKTLRVLTVILISLFFINGCIHLGGFGKFGDESLQGFIFTKIKVPYTKDLNNTPVVEDKNSADGRITQIKEPISGQGIYVQFNSNAIGDIAKEHGLKKVYFADLEKFSILGIWSYEKICLYGE